MKSVGKRTYYNRSEAGLILGYSPSQLRAWEAETRRPGSPLAGSRLFAPARPGCAWSPAPQYHRDQVRLIDRCLHDPEHRQTYEDQWAAMESCLPEMTFAAAEDLGLVEAEALRGVMIVE